MLHRRHIAYAALALAAGVLVGGAARPSHEASVAPAVVGMRALVAAIPRPAPEPGIPEPGRALGRFQFTYYWLANERGHRTADEGETIALMDKACNEIAEVAPNFYRSLRLEGSGILRDGRVVGVAGNCACGAPCFHVSRARFGMGAAQRPLAPFRSVAVDSSLVAIGTRLYIPELDGKTMPGHAPWGGFVHDGCVIADDRGGNIRGKQLDFFTARRGHYESLTKRLGLRRVTVHDGGERCTGKVARPAAMARRGGA